MDETLLPLPVIKPSTGGDEELRDKLMTMYASIFAMRKEIDGRRHPVGSKVTDCILWFDVSHKLSAAMSLEKSGSKLSRHFYVARGRSASKRWLVLDRS